MLLNIKNQVVGMSEVYNGNVSSAMVRAGEVFQEAVRSNCPAIVLVHNHPSGDPTLSRRMMCTSRSNLWMLAGCWT